MKKRESMGERVYKKWNSINNDKNFLFCSRSLFFEYEIKKENQKNVVVVSVVKIDKIDRYI